MAGLAARCNACGTVFRVVPDQLRVAGGYVRCGRCSAVFNAAESLIDLDAVVGASPAPAEPPVEPPLAEAGSNADAEADAALPVEPLQPVAATAPAEPEPMELLGLDAGQPAAEDPIAVPAAEVPDLADLAEPEPGTVAAAEQSVTPPEPGTDFDLDFVEPPPDADALSDNSADTSSDTLPDAERTEAAEAFELDLPESDPATEPASEPAADFAADTAIEPPLALRPRDEARPERIDYDPQAAAAPLRIELTLPPPTSNAPPHQLSLQTAPAAEDLPLRAEPDDLPSFVRSAQRSQRRDSPGQRRRLVVGVALGTLLLAGQAVFTWRDEIVARWPGARPVIEPPCVAFGCRIEAPRAVEALAIESSGLVRVEKSAVYKLQLALRNRSARDVAWPALDLTLSDAQGKPLARRVLRAADFGVNASTLAAGREVAVQATLQTQFADGEPVAGYTIDPFYP